MREFPEFVEGRRAPRGAGCEKFPSGNLLVADSLPGHKEFVEALSFVNKIGALAEIEGHHPDILFHLLE